MSNFLALGFHFGPKRACRATGVTNSQAILEQLIEELGGTWTLLTHNAKNWQPVPNVDVYSLHRVVQSSGDVPRGTSSDFLEDNPDVELVALDMLGRHPSHAARDARSTAGGQLAYRRQQVRGKVAFWEDVFDRHEITHLVASNVPHLTDDYLAYELARYRGIPAIFPYRLPIVPGVTSRLYVPRSLEQHEQVRTSQGLIDVRTAWRGRCSSEDGLPEDLRPFLDEARRNGRSFAELAEDAQAEAPPPRPVKDPRPLVSMASWSDNATDFTVQVRDRIARRTGNERELRRSESVAALSAPFVYFPLHMQPEASSVPLGGSFGDQLGTAATLAESLPPGWSLVVKEHPKQDLTRRLPGWHRRLRAIPRVRVVDPASDTRQLLERAKAVVTLTGTVAFEAMLYGTPAVCLGHSIFRSAPGVIGVSRVSELPATWERLHTADTASIEAFLAALGSISVRGYLEPYTDPRVPVRQEETMNRTVAQLLIDTLQGYDREA